VDLWVVPILVAVISGPIVVLLQAFKFERKNDEQHAHNSGLLREIGEKVDVVGSKLDNHIWWHKGREGHGPQD
jgi:hypothetical protein